jgi:hypothetical protein
MELGAMSGTRAHPTNATARTIRAGRGTLASAIFRRFLIDIWRLEIRLCY